MLFIRPEVTFFHEFNGKWLHAAFDVAFDWDARNPDWDSFDCFLLGA